MRLAVGKGWPPTDVQNAVWHYASIAPSAKAIRGVILEHQSHPHAWTRVLIIPKDGAHVKAGMGRRVVNPCWVCEEAELTGVTDYCGQCRSRPVVRRARRMSYLGMGCSQLTDVSPRTRITDCSARLWRSASLNGGRCWRQPGETCPTRPSTPRHLRDHQRRLTIAS